MSKKYVKIFVYESDSNEVDEYENFISSEYCIISSLNQMEEEKIEEIRDIIEGLLNE